MKTLRNILIALLLGIIISPANTWALNLKNEAPVPDIQIEVHVDPEPQVFLLTFLWINERWVPGWDVPGWSPREQDSLIECLKRANTLDNSPAIAVEVDGKTYTAEHTRGRCMEIVPFPIEE